MLSRVGFLVDVAVQTGLDEKDPPTTHLEVDIDGVAAQKTIAFASSANPKWLPTNQSMIL